MTSRTVTLIGYVLIAAAAIGIEAMARRSGRLTTFGEVIALALRRWPCRILLQAGWLWIGWHLFVRAG